MTDTLFDLPTVTAGTTLAGGDQAGVPANPTRLAGTPRVLGLDLSMTGTGVGGAGWGETIRFRGRRAHETRTDYVHARLAYLLGTLGDYLTGVHLAVLEGLATGPGMDMDRQLAGLSWMVRDLLYRHEIPYVLVAPGQLKKYVVGKGRRTVKQAAAEKALGITSKTAVLQVVRGWYPGFDGDDNAADAIGLAAMGADHLGYPFVYVPEPNRAVLDLITWPEHVYA